jgi:hypothetical protein
MMRWAKRWRVRRRFHRAPLPSFDLTQLLPGEQNEVLTLRQRINAAAGIAAAIGKPTLALAFDGERGELEIRPDAVHAAAETQRLDVTQMMSLVKGRLFKVLWSPGSNLGLGPTICTAAPEEFPRLAEAISRRADLVAELFPPQAVVFLHHRQKRCLAGTAP